MRSHFKKLGVLRKFHDTSELAIFCQDGTAYCDVGIMEIQHGAVSYEPIFL